MMLTLWMGWYMEISRTKMFTMTYTPCTTLVRSFVILAGSGGKQCAETMMPFTRGRRGTDEIKASFIFQHRSMKRK